MKYFALKKGLFNFRKIFACYIFLKKDLLFLTVIDFNITHTISWYNLLYFSYVFLLNILHYLYTSFRFVTLYYSYLNCLEGKKLHLSLIKITYNCWYFNLVARKLYFPLKNNYHKITFMYLCTHVLNFIIHKVFR